jgi:hypothetical protein
MIRKRQALHGTRPVSLVTDPLFQDCTHCGEFIVWTEDGYYIHINAFEALCDGSTIHLASPISNKMEWP